MIIWPIECGEWWWPPFLDSNSKRLAASISCFMEHSCLAPIHLALLISSNYVEIPTEMESIRPNQVPADSLPAMWVSHLGSGPFRFSWPFQLTPYRTGTNHAAKPHLNCRLVSTINWCVVWTRMVCYIAVVEENRTWGNW